MVKTVLYFLNIVIIAATTFGISPLQSPYNVRDFGATGDGKTLDTNAIQDAVNACAANNGGTVFFSPGVYLSGSIQLQSNVTLYLDNGAIIKSSPDNANFDPPETLDFENDADKETSFFHYALIWGEDIEHIGIIGQGVIDGNRKRRGGPKSIALKRCRHVTIRDVQLKNCPNYNISLLGTDFVKIDGVTILHGFADGIDPDACKNVHISNCHIETNDDAIVPKASFSLGERRSCENIMVTNCFLATECYCFKLGTESGGDFKWITVNNCVMKGIENQKPASGGIALESVDGAHIDGVAVSNISMDNVQAPIFLRLGNRGRDMKEPVPGSLQNVSISNIVAHNASLCCSISGIPDCNVEDVTLADIRILYRGGSTIRSLGETVPEVISDYPDADMFGAMPAYGLYCRHVSGLTLSNVQLLAKENFWRLAMTNVTRVNDPKLNWKTNPPGGSSPAAPGPTLVCDDVSRLTVNGLQCSASRDGTPLIGFNNVREAIVADSKAPAGTMLFLKVDGAETDNITLIGNDFCLAEKVVEENQTREKIILEANRIQ